jgi:hypothetical protein
MLFDLAADPGEKNDRSAVEAAVVAGLVPRIELALEGSVESVPIEAPREVAERLRALGYGVGSGEK